MKFVRPLLHVIFRLGYFGPLAMGVLDSSFLILPFGNDFVVVSMVAHHPDQVVWYVAMAAVGSSLGAALLAITARRLGEEGLTRVADKRTLNRVKSKVGRHAGFAVAIGGLAPPPFPFTTVIAIVAVLGYPIWRILLVNFSARLTRFTVLALLALRFGKQVLHVAQSPPFVWTMGAFIVLCAIASAFSIARWVLKPHVSQSKAKAA